LKPHKVITAKHEYELLAVAQGPDARAAKWAVQELIEAHRPFVATMINRFTAPTWVEHADLEQSAILGLLHGIRHFDMSQGYRLLTFAGWHVRKEIVKYLSEMGYAAKVPFQDIMKLKKILNRHACETFTPDLPWKVVRVTVAKKARTRKLVPSRTEFLENPEDPEGQPEKLKKEPEPTEIKLLLIGPEDDIPENAVVVTSAPDPESAAALHDELRMLGTTKAIHIQALLGGALSIHPTDVSHAPDSQKEDTGYAQVTDLPIGSDLVEYLVSDETVESLNQLVSHLSAMEGSVFGAFHGLYHHTVPLDERDIAGEVSEIVATPDGLDATAGSRGFGLEVGKTPAAIKKLIDRTRTRFRAIIEKYRPDLGHLA